MKTDAARTSGTSPGAPRKPVRRFPGLVGLPPEPEESKAAIAVLTSPAISEDELREQFGIDTPTKRPEIPKSFRLFFGLQPEDLMTFFDTQLGTYTAFEEVEAVVSKDVLRHRVQRIQCVINEREKIIEGLSVRVMKIRRGKDNVLDKETREKYKRGEEKKLTRLYSKRARLRAAIASPLEYRAKVWRTVEKPLRFRDLVDDWMTFDKAFVKAEDGWTVIVTSGSFDLQSYRDVMRLDAGALEIIEENKEAWDNLRVWENNVIAAAVIHGLFHVRRDLMELLGFDDLTKKLDEQVAEDDFIEETTTWNGLDAEILESTDAGGLAGRIRIQTGGWRYRKSGAPVARPLSSFDRPTRMSEKKRSNRLYHTE